MCSVVHCLILSFITHTSDYQGETEDLSESFSLMEALHYRTLRQAETQPGSQMTTGNDRKHPGHSVPVKDCAPTLALPLCTGLQGTTRFISFISKQGREEVKQMSDPPALMINNNKLQ